MARSRTGEQRPNRMNSLAVATNDAADIALSKLQLEDGCSAARIFLDQATHGLGRLRAFADPVFRPIQFQRAVVTGFFRIVCADDLDEFSVAWAAAVGHHDFVIGAILRSFSA